ncbi:MAG: XdhC family protein [Pyrinomonadaceae bacterium]
MSKELELWQFVRTRLERDECIMLLVVATSSGSSPGRAGYKMAVAVDGELCGSIGGGVMEVALVEATKRKTDNGKRKTTKIVEQVHQKNVPNSSGMICSGRQTVIVKQLDVGDLGAVDAIIDCLEQRKPAALEISDAKFQLIENTRDDSRFYSSKTSETKFTYQERVGYKHNLFIIGGGHCALALSEVMSRLGFHISVFDDRPDLNTIEKNRFANEITVIDSYEKIAHHVPSGGDSYVVVMTIGYKFDEIVIRRLFDKNFRYFGVLGSRAKMKTLLKALDDDGLDRDRIASIHTPVGLAINSRTPEEIAVSIAAEIIAVKNS